MTSPALKANIKEVTTSGEVRLRFSDTMLVPDNITVIDYKVLQVGVIASPLSPPELDKQISSWNVTSFNQRELVL